VTYETVKNREIGLHFRAVLIGGKQMSVTQIDNFGSLFENKNYVLLKNYLYNYLLRKRAVEKNVSVGNQGIILEVGSGLSPMVTNINTVIYSELSFEALRILKRQHSRGGYVAADGMRLPFKAGIFDQTICSEVLEHLTDDRKALEELARVMKPSGQLIITFPHRKFYFTYDDHYVNHLRRYELSEMEDRLRAAGFNPISIQKILGPLEKVTMWPVVYCFSLMQRYKPDRSKVSGLSNRMSIVAPLFKWVNVFYAGLVWLDAKIMPRSLATVLLIRAEKAR
jgi:SAM-dependent methyltransferase